MSDKGKEEKITTSDGIIVEASLDLLRKAAKKVLFEFDEVHFDIDGEIKSLDLDMGPGDSAVFEEKIKQGPAQIVVVRVAYGFWYIISTSQMPKGGYGSGRDAMRAAEAEEKRERIFKEFLRKEAGVKKVEDVCDWEPDLRADAADVLGIINQASRKWKH